jgi:hypothetical protein
MQAVLLSGKTALAFKRVLSFTGAKNERVSALAFAIGLQMLDQAIDEVLSLRADVRRERMLTEIKAVVDGKARSQAH